MTGPVVPPAVTGSAGDALHGLSTDEAQRRLLEAGPNQVGRRRPLPVRSRVFAQLRDPLIVVLLAAAVLTIATGDWTDAAVISLVVVVNTAVGVVQEIRADQAITALSELTAPTARVRRGGRELEVPADAVVPGDIVLLGEGDIVPADGVAVEASALLVDEAALTGESVPVGKLANDADNERLFAGTVVVKGRAVAQITATGAGSTLGRIAALVDTAPGATPLQRRLAELGRTLAIVAVALCAVVLALGIARGEPTELMVVTAISLAVAAVPESLPAVITLSLALGARQMARRQAIARRLAAVETLGSVTVLATDKTGTLTTGRMAVEQIWTPAGDQLALIELLTAAALCNDARLVAHDDQPNSRDLGDPTEVAILLAAQDVGLVRAAIEERHPRVAEVPFDSVRQRMMTLHRDPEGILVCVKGAPESVVRPDVLAGADHDRTQALQRAAELARAGYRVLAVASAHRNDVPDRLEDAETGLRLLGLVAIADPPKAAAADTVAACKKAGITPILITGDHPATARAIAARAGILDDDSAGTVITGQQIRDGAVDAPSTARVFARITPEQKLDIIQELRDRGEIVAMVGDGVNDGPALRRSDIGVAMGRRGTEVARQAADLVLADDELGTVVGAVEEGRRIYANVRRFLTYGLAGGTAEIVIMLVGPFVGLTLPLRAAQILWINLVTHGLTGVALGAEPAEPGSMQRPPRPPGESVLGDGLWARVLRAATAIATVALLVGWWGHDSGREWQSMVFVSLTTLQLGVALGLRALPGSRANPFLLLAVAGSLLLVMAGLYVPPLRDLLDTAALPVADLAIAVAVGVLGWLVIRADVRLGDRRRASQSSALR
jgi:P-type Ca2+ transporter type 2C